MTYSIGDRVAYQHRVWHIERLVRYGWESCGYALLTLIDPESRERRRGVMSHDCEPAAVRPVELRIRLVIDNTRNAP